jgi:hypothetical protein
MKLELTKNRLGDGWSCGKTHRRNNDWENVDDKTLLLRCKAIEMMWHEKVK